MKEIRNKTSRPIRIGLPGGKTLHLGPSQVAQIADHAADHPEIQKLVTEEVIELLGEGERSTENRGPGAAKERTRGNLKSFRRGQGDR